MEIRELIRTIIYNSRLSQTEIAKVLGCTQATVSRIKNHKQVPTLKVAQGFIKLAKTYKIQVTLEDIEFRE